MKLAKFIIILLMFFVMIGCNRKNSIEIFNGITPIYSENKTISTAGMDKIYEIYDLGFGGSSLFDYLVENNINKYRFDNKEESFLYTAIKVEERGILYIFLEKSDKEYIVSYLLYKNKLLTYDNEDFATLKIGQSTIENVIEIDDNTKYNTFYTSSIGTITTHFLNDDEILQIYYTTDLLQQIKDIRYENKEGSIGYISAINDIDWY